MPHPVQACLFAAAILLAAAPARAEMTEADRASMNTFTACLEQTAGNENACLEKLGRYAWYPKSGACEAIAALVHKVITDGNQAEWRDLFFNERCARLNVPHDRDAAAAGDTDPETSPEGRTSRRLYVDCLDGKLWNDEVCFEKVGRHRWYDEDIYCAVNRDFVELTAKQQEIHSWKLLFHNERCHRRGVWHYEPER